MQAKNSGTLKNEDQSWSTDNQLDFISIFESRVFGSDCDKLARKSFR
jgi:hypothetical protein